MKKRAFCTQNMAIGKQPPRSRLNLYLMLSLLLFLWISSCSKSNHHLASKIICIDPGHGGTAAYDQYRVGPTGEREEWINLRVAQALRNILESRGATVIMTRTEDVSVSLKNRALSAVEHNADVFISIHHNATADSTVNFPIIYFHGNASENRASVRLGQLVAKEITDTLYTGSSPVSLVSDHVIFPGTGTAVLRHSYGIPGVIGEASFFTHPAEEQRLKKAQYNLKEARAYAQALEKFFQEDTFTISKKYSRFKLPPFEVFQEEERMRPAAKKWHHNFIRAKELYTTGNPDSLDRAYALFTLSARSFPDSYVACKCHLYRAKILEQKGQSAAADTALLRVRQYYADPGLEG